MPQLAIAKDFLSTYATLDEKLHKDTDEALEQFAATYYAGGHPEKVIESRAPVAHSHDMQRERNLLFVACTRAQDSLYVSHASAPSPFLPRSSLPGNA